MSALSLKEMHTIHHLIMMAYDLLKQPELMQKLATITKWTSYSINVHSEKSSHRISMLYENKNEMN